MESLSESTQPVKTVEELHLVEHSHKNVTRGENGAYAKDSGEGGASHTREMDDNLRLKTSYWDSVQRITT